MPEQAADILARLEELHPKKIDLSLGRMERLLAALDNPHHDLPPVIHIAGTNGKGSTLAFLRAYLEETGKRVHLYSSPHLADFSERIYLAGAYIRPKALSALLAEVEAANAGHPITFFEITTAAAFLAFSRIDADILLLETGLGGRLDATNLVEKPLASIITTIDLDHQAFLGETLTDIATEKAGILKENVPAIIGKQPAEAAIVLREKAAEKNVPLTAAKRDFIMEHHKTRWDYFGLEQRFKNLPDPALPGRHQRENAALAFATIERLGWPLTQEQALKTLKEVLWPGRFQAVKKGGLTENLPDGWAVYLDGGHNPAAARAVADTLPQVAGERPIHMIGGMLASKDSKGFFQALAPVLESFTAVDIPGHDGMSAEDLAHLALVSGVKNTDVNATVEAALEKLTHDLKAPACILIGGSLYLLGEILKKHPQ